VNAVRPGVALIIERDALSPDGAAPTSNAHILCQRSVVDVPERSANGARVS